MPKILDDIHTKILLVAQELYQQNGYENTDMREIAQRAQIAVGTIYHYFQDKEDLYIQVNAHNWTQTFEKVDALSRKSGEPRQLLREMLQTLAMDMAEHKPFSRLWKEIATMHLNRSPSPASDQPFIGMHRSFSESFGRVLLKMFSSPTTSQESALVERLGSFAFVMAVDVCMLPSEEIIRQTGLITDLLCLYIDKMVHQV